MPPRAASIKETAGRRPFWKRGFSPHPSSQKLLGNALSGTETPFPPKVPGPGAGEDLLSRKCPRFPSMPGIASIKQTAGRHPFWKRGFSPHPSSRKLLGNAVSGPETAFPPEVPGGGAGEASFQEGAPAFNPETVPPTLPRNGAHRPDTRAAWRRADAPPRRGLREMHDWIGNGDADAPLHRTYTT